MRDQVSKVHKTAYPEIGSIGSVRRYLTTEATQFLVSSLVISRLGYCSSFLAGVPQKHLDKLQRVMNCEARLICRASKREHSSPLLFCTGFLCLTESSTRLPLLSATMRSRALRLRILLIYFGYTLPLGISANPLIHASFAFRSDASNSSGSPLFLILALSSGIVPHFLSAMFRLCRVSNNS